MNMEWVVLELIILNPEAIVTMHMGIMAKDPFISCGRETN
mgnify:CR=1 FL=1